MSGNHQNGEAVTKYIKVKSGGKGVSNAAGYIDDPDKTMLAGESRVDEMSDEIYSVGAVTDYMANDMKIINPEDKKHLATGINCNADSVAEDFKICEQMYHRHKTETLKDGHKANSAFHVILSYKGTDIDPEIVHKMGVEYAERLCGDEFQAFVCTHLNTNNWHDHILINAYALDGKHKFLDEWKMYKKLREIADEISIEYGLPINVNGQDSRKAGKNLSYKEYMETEEGASWKAQIRKDLDACIASSDTYDDVIGRMKSLGYDIQDNKNSKTFVTETAKIRDRRLGREYTEDGINEAIEKRKADEEYQKELEEYRRIIAEKKKLMPVNNPVRLARYDELGRRRSLLLMLLMIIRHYIEQSIVREAQAELAKLAEHSSAFLSPAKKLAAIDKTIDLCTRYGITDEAVLDMRLRELHADSAPKKDAVRQLETYLENAAEIREACLDWKENVIYMDSLGIDIADIGYVPDADTIAENQARLVPMSKRTKSDLYQALHGSKYCLATPFSHLTEPQAKEIITAIRNDKMTDLPDGLTYGTRAKRQAAEPAKPHPFDLSGYNKDEKELIVRMKKTADILGSVGIKNVADIDRFLAEYDAAEDRITTAQEKADSVAAEISALYRLKKNLTDYQRALFVCGTDDPDLTAGYKASRDALLQTRDDYETYTYLRERLSRMDRGVDPKYAGKRSIPDPVEYRFLRDYASVSGADISGISSGKDVHEAVERIRKDRLIDRELERIDGREKDRRHDR